MLRSDPALALGRDFDALPVLNGRYCKAELWDALAGVQCPILVMRGVGSAVLPPLVARRMIETTANAAPLSVVGRAGHAVMMDNPAGFRAAVATFLDGCTLD